MKIDEIRDNFSLLEEWDDRYRYVIELGRTLEPMPEAEHSQQNKVQGCVSQVWLSKRIDRDGGKAPVLKYRGDSDAHIVRGLIAILLRLFSGQKAKDILTFDVEGFFRRIGLEQFISTQRRNGLQGMVRRMRGLAAELTK